MFTGSFLLNETKGKALVKVYAAPATYYAATPGPNIPRYKFIFRIAPAIETGPFLFDLAFRISPKGGAAFTNEHEEDLHVKALEARVLKYRRTYLNVWQDHFTDVVEMYARLRSENSLNLGFSFIFELWLTSSSTITFHSAWMRYTAVARKPKVTWDVDEMDGELERLFSDGWVVL
uniref:Uncharacterized protein n=1 Tax=Phasmatodean tombus-related virus TaxID=2822558 RepID=A0A8A6RPA9_9TOMB|nr:hypothetical protein [Phasmatodean tombus-related virus]